MCWQPDFPPKPNGGGETSNSPTPTSQWNRVGLCGIGQGKVAGSAAEAMARNPERQAGIRFALNFSDWCSLNR